MLSRQTIALHQARRNAGINAQQKRQVAQTQVRALIVPQRKKTR